MDKDCFNGSAGIPLMEFQSSPMAVHLNGPNCPSELGFLNPNLDQYSHLDPSLNSPMATTSQAFFLRELIGKLGVRAGAVGNVPGESSFVISAKAQFPIVDHVNPNLENFPNLGNLSNTTSLPPPAPPLAAIPADPGFIERAAKFSCFGSRSFNGRTSSIGQGSCTAAPLLMSDSKLPRVSSSPALKPTRNSTLTEIKPGILSGSDKKPAKLSGSAANSNDESSVSEQIPSGETSNSRKRKGPSRGSKPKEEPSIPVKGDDDQNAKRCKPTESGSGNEAEGGGGKTCSDNDDKAGSNKKPPEPPKDYIHVRARRGQATDSHSLAERVRREKISERMKLLQDLVPGCNKVTGKALMLDEIINYVQSLQRQVEFLSMKLASVNPGLDFNMESLVSKDMFQHSTGLTQQIYTAPPENVPLYQQTVPHTTSSSISRGPVDPIHFSPVDGFTENFPQFPGFSEDDLQSIVQMGFVQNHPANYPVANMKIER